VHVSGRHRFQDFCGLGAYKRDAVEERLFGLVEASVKPLAQRHPRREVAQAARVLWGAVHGFCMLKLTNKLNVAGEDSAHELVEVLFRRFLQGDLAPLSQTPG